MVDQENIKPELIVDDDNYEPVNIKGIIKCEAKDENDPELSYNSYIAFTENEILTPQKEV